MHSETYALVLLLPVLVTSLALPLDSANTSNLELAPVQCFHGDQGPADRYDCHEVCDLIADFTRDHGNMKFTLRPNDFALPSPISTARSTTNALPLPPAIANPPGVEKRDANLTAEQPKVGIDAAVNAPWKTQYESCIGVVQLKAHHTEALMSAELIRKQMWEIHTRCIEPRGIQFGGWVDLGGSLHLSLGRAPWGDVGGGGGEEEGAGGGRLEGLGGSGE